MSSETRVIRPYTGVDRFQQILDGFRLRCGPDEIEPGTSRSIPSSYFLETPVVLLSPSEIDLPILRAAAVAAATEVGLEATDIDLVVSASTPYLRLLDVVYRANLGLPDAIPESVTLTSGQTRALQTPSGGLDLEVCFALNQSLSPRALRPHRLGTWLGRVNFSLRTELGELGFTPRPLTKEEKTALGLPPETVRFVRVDASALMADDMADAVEFYVDEVVLAVLNSGPNTAGARTFMRQMFMDMMAAIVQTVRSNDVADIKVADLELSDVEGTVLGRVLYAAAGTLPREGREIRRQIALDQLKNEPQLLLSHLEASARFDEDLQQTITGVDE